MQKIKFFTLIFSIGTFAFFSSCQNATKESSSSQKKDSLYVIDSKLQKVFKAGSLPFIVDTAILSHLENYDSLGSYEIQTLTQHILKHNLTDGLEYDLKNFYKIDSVKAIGKYKEYCDSLQIGAT